MNKKQVFITGGVFIGILFVLVVFGGYFYPKNIQEFGAPSATYQRSLLPETADIYDLGTSSRNWNTLFVNTITASGTSATSSFANGINMTDGCYAIDNTCIGTTNGTVTSVDMSVPTGLSISGNPITTSGTLAVSLTSGYIIPSYPITSSYFIATSTATSTFSGGLEASGIGSPFFFATSTTATSTFIAGVEAADGRFTDNLQIHQICNDIGECWNSPSVAGSNINLYPWNTSSDIATYEELYTNASTTLNVDESCTADADVDGGYCTIDTYVSTTTDITIYTYPAGITTIHAYTYSGSTAGNTYLVFDGYRRDSGGTEYWMGQATTSDIDSTSAEEFTASFASGSDTDFSTDGTDRLVMKVRAYTDSSAGRLVHWVYGRTGLYSYLETPITQADVGYTKKFNDEAISGLWSFSNTGTTTFSGGIVSDLFAAPYFIATSTTATSSSAGGFIISGGGLRVSNLGTAAGTFLAVDANGSVIATSTPGGSGTVTSIATTYPVTGGTITTTGTIALAFGTTTANTWSALQDFTNASSSLFSVRGTATTTMSAGLEVGGKIATPYVLATSTTASSTFSNGIIITGGCLYIDGACLTDTDTTYTATYPITLSGTIFSLAFGTTTANSWSSLQQFTNASSTLFSVGGTATSTFSAGVETSELGASIITATSSLGVVADGGTRSIPAYYYPSFSYSTSTSWAGTTTIPLGMATIQETWASAQCFTDIGTLNIEFGDWTATTTVFNASTTVGTVTFGSNNTFTAGDKRYVEIGSPASSPTKISCTIKKSY